MYSVPYAVTMHTQLQALLQCTHLLCYAWAT
jgi:hypothetical protein